MDNKQMFDDSFFLRLAKNHKVVLTALIILLVVCIVFQVPFTIRFKDFEATMNHLIEERVQQYEQERAKELAFHEVFSWSNLSTIRLQNLVIQELPYIRSKTLIVWMFNLPFWTGYRRVFYSYDPLGLLKNSNNANRLWFDTIYRTEAVLTNQLLIVYANIDDFDPSRINHDDIVIGFKVIDGTGRVRTDLGNVVVYMRISIGSYPVGLIALDFDAKNAEELEEIIQISIDRLPIIKTKIEQLLIDVNRDVLNIKYIWQYNLQLLDDINKSICE